jgi:hypothetical protein
MNGPRRCGWTSRRKSRPAGSGGPNAPWVLIAWCEYGSPEELPNIYHRKQYEEELDLVPDYRITCIFVDRRYRQKGLSAVALQGALDLISGAGGGVVEGYPHDAQGKKKSVLYNGTRTLFERAGFTFVRSKGTGNCVVRRTVPRPTAVI